MPDVGIRCPGCGRKLGDYIVGLYSTTCPRCHKPVIIKQAGEARTIDAEGRRLIVRATVDDDDAP